MEDSAEVADPDPSSCPSSSSRREVAERYDTVSPLRVTDVEGRGAAGGGCPGSWEALVGTAPDPLPGFEEVRDSAVLLPMAMFRPRLGGGGAPGGRIWIP